MNQKPISQSLEKDVQDITAALLRASQRARIIAEQTKTAFVIVRNGKLVKEYPGGQKES